MNKKLAVAMSVYRNDRADYLDSSITSLYKQSITEFDIYLQVDGLISVELQKIIDKYAGFNNFFCEYSPENKGLAFQLNNAIGKILATGEYAYIARMDADDICMQKRFEEQINFFDRNPDVAVLGTSMIEFDQFGNETVKIMPVAHEELAKNIIKRCPFNHPTVMFNLNIITPEDLKYDGKLRNTQDYYLWVDLLKIDYKFANLAEPLLKFRVDEKFHSRRGLKKAMNDINSRFYAMKELKIFSIANLIHVLMLFGLRTSPTFIKKWAYKYLR